MFKELNPGSAIIIIPINPTITASHLYNPTFSLRKKIEKIVVKIGAAKGQRNKRTFSQIFK